jgi:predicted NAD/FAD-dependent oxidoreductase
MRCNFPQHHSAGSGVDLGKGGSWGTLGAAVIAAAVFAPLIGVIIHVLALVLTFVGIAAVASGSAWAWWRLSHRQPRELRMQYRPQMQASPRWQQPRVDQQQQAAVGGPQFHFHTAEAVEAFRRAVEGR